MEYLNNQMQKNITQNEIETNKELRKETLKVLKFLSNKYNKENKKEMIEMLKKIIDMCNEDLK